MDFCTLYEATIIIKHPVYVISELRTNCWAGQEAGRVGQHFLVLKHDTSFGQLLHTILGHMQYGHKKKQRMDNFEIPAQLKLRKKRVVMAKLHLFCILGSICLYIGFHRTVSYRNVVFSIMVFVTTLVFCKRFSYVRKNVSKYLSKSPVIVIIKYSNLSN